PVRASQSRAVWSDEEVTTRLPSGLKATVLISFLCPARTNSNRPVAASQRRAVLSGYRLPETRCDPSGLKSTELTAAEWPRSTATASPLSPSQRQMSLQPAPADTSRLPSGL